MLAGAGTSDVAVEGDVVVLVGGGAAVLVGGGAAVEGAVTVAGACATATAAAGVLAAGPAAPARNTSSSARPTHSRRHLRERGLGRFGTVRSMVFTSRNIGTRWARVAIGCPARSAPFEEVL